jgi:hypothetical protein
MGGVVDTIFVCFHCVCQGLDSYVANEFCLEHENIRFQRHYLGIIPKHQETETLLGLNWALTTK